MELKVIHTETIKPSSPTPSHKKHLQLSFLDQIEQAHFVPFIYFYQWNYSMVGEGDGITTRLKKSLSDTLTWYYPLAGRIRRDMLVVECNDEGAPYFETQVNCNLKEVADQRKCAVLNSLCPFSDQLEDAGDVPLAVQINFFSCGGVAIGVCLNHAIADALSILMFVRFWGAVACGDHNSMASPQFGMANIFPPRRSTESRVGVGIPEDKHVVAKNFLFTKSSISALKIKYGTRTSVEALTTFILTRFLSNASQKRELVGCGPIVALNLRTRLNPPLPESHFGNISYVVGTYVLFKDGVSRSIQELDGYGCLTKIRDAIVKGGVELVKKLREGDSRFTTISDDNDKMILKKHRENGNTQMLALNFSSLSKFPMYDTDFGWGRPIWATLGIFGVNNQFIFMPTPSGDGIEVQFCTSDGDLKSLEVDKEFLTFATLAGNPNLPILSSL